MKIMKALENESFAKFAKGAAGAVYATTAIKAIGRPAFIYADKNSDAETKKYTAGKEFLYQVLCLGITVAMIPFFRAGGLKMAEKHLKAEPLLKELTENISKASFLKKVGIFEKEYEHAGKLPEAAQKAMNLGKGGTELGSFVGSILGLTIIAPLLSHEILHPIMHALNLEKKENGVGKPNEIFLADAKVATEKSAPKLNANA